MTVSTAEELDALAIHTILRSQPSGVVWEVASEDTEGLELRYRSTEGDVLYTSRAMARRGPFQVIAHE
jgi:hypothetical protein